MNKTLFIKHILIIMSLYLIHLIIKKYTSYIPTVLEHYGPQAFYWKERWPSLQKRLKTAALDPPETEDDRQKKGKALPVQA